MTGRIDPRWTSEARDVRVVLPAGIHHCRRWGSIVRNKVEISSIKLENWGLYRPIIGRIIR